ncbi:hypothetical protein ITP53_06895 [Nonomuraea sp. K274]|uniref:Uncharacterized protein n=1 Tax=Nonomuraea cypriaca TaxID=1187855 RepID=A0A931A8S3_9ACTN|nr:hypothetical protein [Nonomuraea cypriaca]MBF8185470.1 hypothetical protein [Nonomuraea cypriaca]
MDLIGAPGTWELNDRERDMGTLSKVIYIDSAGREYAVDATAGDTVMATAAKHGVPGASRNAAVTVPVANTRRVYPRRHARLTAEGR